MSIADTSQDTHETYMKTVTINFIIHNRFNYLKRVLQQLINIDDSVKSIFNINLLVSEYSKSLEEEVNNLKASNIEVNTFLVTGSDNYMTKIRTAVDNSGTYAISIDVDIFIPTNVWKYFIENLNVLNDTKNIFLSPTITSGIPSTDLFIDRFLSSDEQLFINNLFTNTYIPNIWGADYSILNTITTSNSQWDSESFYSAVSGIDHHYRGVHPLRFSHAAQKFLNDICIKNVKKYCDCSEFTLKYLKRPYFCNSVFGIRTDIWKQIINDSSLFRDEFDEVPLNLYMRNNDLNMVFIEGGVAIHPSYNTINIYGHDYSRLSDEFFNCDYFK